MQLGLMPTLFHEFHTHEPISGLETLWFYKTFDPNGPDPRDDPKAVKLIGPVSSRECATVAEGVKLAFAELGFRIAEEHGADD